MPLTLQTPLHDHHLVATAGLEEPMNMVSPTDDEVRELGVALRYFEVCDTYTTFPYDTFYMYGYRPALVWLAALIVRGAVVRDLYVLIECMRCDSEVGSLDEDELSQVWPEDRWIVVNQMAQPMEPLVPGRWPMFCFWLPHSLGENVELLEVCRLFDREKFVPFESLNYALMSSHANTNKHFTACRNHWPVTF